MTRNGRGRRRHAAAPPSAGAVVTGVAPEAYASRTNGAHGGSLSSIAPFSCRNSSCACTCMQRLRRRGSRPPLLRTAGPETSSEHATCVTHAGGFMPLRRRRVDLHMVRMRSMHVAEHLPCRPLVSGRAWRPTHAPTRSEPAVNALHRVHSTRSAPVWQIPAGRTSVRCRRGPAPAPPSARAATAGSGWRPSGRRRNGARALVPAARPLAPAHVISNGLAPVSLAPASVIKPAPASTTRHASVAA